MKYEIAKRLKDAGFKYIDFEIMQVGEDKLMVNEQLPSIDKLIDSVTLEHDLCELSIVMNYFTDKDGTLVKRWHATKNDGYHDTQIGETLEEALANLWLEINKEDTN